MAPTLLILSFLFLLILLYVSPSQQVQLGDNLDLKVPWISQQGTFTFGFSTSNISGLFNLAIWYGATPEVIIWKAMSAATKKPVEVSKDAQLVLQSTGLVLEDGSKTIWSTELPCGNCVARADMQDNGNFVLLDSNNNTVWESFHSPTDTIVPGQDLVGNTTLVSGKYMLKLNESSVGLYYTDYSTTESYWSILNIGLSLNGSKGVPPQLKFGVDGLINFYDGSGQDWDRQKYDKSQRFPLDYENVTVLRRLTLENNGTIRSYSLAAGDKTWRVVWQAELQECDVYGTCGVFGMCSYEPRKRCKCPPGFSQVDPNNESAGCHREVPLTCDASSNAFIQVNRAHYRGNDYNVSLNSSFMPLKECKNVCLKDCKCLAAVYSLDGYGQCILKGGNTSGMLYNGVQFLDRAFISLLKVSKVKNQTLGSDPVSTQSAFVTLVDGDPVSIVNPAKDTGYFSMSGHVVAFSFAIAEFVLFSLLGLVSWLYWRRSMHQMWKKANRENQGATRFTYEQLQQATHEFNEKLGSGGFGSVYKGMLPDKTLVAVKNVEVATHAEKQFKAEVTTLGSIHHVNLVKLLGYCAEGNHRLLVYEYMSEGSLDKILFSNQRHFSEFAWKTRFSVALGIARGIAYLHEECYYCILHCDIKPQNILLDADFNPKVSDFGLAKLLKKEGLSVTTIHGTRGYLAPEWVSSHAITAKADVYSYGMVLLELLTGQNISEVMAASSKGLPTVAFQRYESGDLQGIADNKLHGDIDWAQFKRTLKVALLCTQPEASLRPRMSQVVKMLEDSEADMMPLPSFPGARFHSRDSDYPIPTEFMSIQEPR